MSGGGYSQQMNGMSCSRRVEDSVWRWVLDPIFLLFDARLPVLPASLATPMVLLSRNPQKDFALCSASLISTLEWEHFGLCHILLSLSGHRVARVLPDTCDDGLKSTFLGLSR